MQQQRVAVAVLNARDLPGLRAAVERMENPFPRIREGEGEDVVRHRSFAEELVARIEAVGPPEESINAPRSVPQVEVARGGVPVANPDFITVRPAQAHRGTGRRRARAIGSMENKVQAASRNLEVHRGEL